MKIFLIAGKTGSGKDDIASIIYNYYVKKGNKPLITEFSKYLKLYAKEMHAWDGNTPTPHKFLQDLGITIRDNMEQPLFLVNRMLEDLKIYELYNDIVIISDVRLPAEIDEIRNNYQDVTAIYIVNQFSPSNLSLSEQTSITETALETYPDFDYTITNDDKSTLENKVLNILEG